MTGDDDGRAALLELVDGLVAALRDGATALRAHGDRSRKLAVTFDAVGNATEDGTVSPEAIADMMAQIQRLMDELPAITEATGRMADLAERIQRRGAAD